MSESDTMLNKRDRICAAVQILLSTDPSYDNRTIASTLKMQIWIATNNRDVPWVMKTKFPATVIVFGVVSREGPHHGTSHLRSGRPWVLQQDSARTHKSKETQAWLQKECYDFIPFSHCPPPSRPELLHLVIRREHHQHDLPQHQSQPDRRHPRNIRRAPAGA